MLKLKTENKQECYQKNCSTVVDMKNIKLKPTVTTYEKGRNALKDELDKIENQNIGPLDVEYIGIRIPKQKK